MKKYVCDILIVGGGTGGTAAAIQAVSAGYHVIIVEETKWLGGQMTSQGVSALDEHPLMKKFGGTSLYYTFQNHIRNYYTNNFRISPKGKSVTPFNPSSNKNRLCFEPQIGAMILQRMLQSHANRESKIFFHCRVVHLTRVNDQIRSVIVRNLKDNENFQILPKIVIDATEMGDLFPLAKIPYRKGKESFAETNEPSAANQSNPFACQAFTFSFAVERRPGENHVIPKPKLYEEMKERHKFTLNGFQMFTAGRFPTPFWEYRLLIDASNFNDPRYSNDISLINFLCMDYDEETIIDQPEHTIQYHLDRAKQLSLSYLYWLQTEVPRDDGGNGYPELKLRKDLMGTDDGLSQYPYIRESRRLAGLYTIKEQDIVYNYNSGPRAVFYPDSVGIGWYIYTDIHKCSHTKNRVGSGQILKPYQIPLGAMITDSVTNLIAGAKNISTTHITNSAYRFHPVEWNIGESAGVLAAFSLKERKTPLEIYHNLRWLRRFQQKLLEKGIPLYWYTDVPLQHPSFMAVQFLTIEGIISDSSSDLLFRPDHPLNRITIQNWLTRLKRRYRITPSLFNSLQKMAQGRTRGEFAQRLYNLVQDLRLLHVSL